MSKTRTGLPAHRLAPGVGGGGYLVAPVFRVNRLFEAFVSVPTEAGVEAKAWPWVPERRTLEVHDRVDWRPGSYRSDLRKARGKFLSFSSAGSAASPARGGLYRPSLCLSTLLFSFLSKASKAGWTPENSDQTVRLSHRPARWLFQRRAVCIDRFPALQPCF